MQNNVTSQQASSPMQRPVRLHYLDWLRVLAILMVVLFHAVHPFDFGGWHIKNAEQSEIITILLILLSLWGMPFFFLVAGAASWFALQRRTPGQYVSERFKRLLVPFIVGTILFRPIVTYLEWMNRVQRGDLAVSFQEFLSMIAHEYASLGFSPGWFGFGEHLWFLGFLFSFALITLPLFLWLKREPGRRIVSRMAGLCEHRGGHPGQAVDRRPRLICRFSRPLRIDHPAGPPAAGPVRNEGREVAPQAPGAKSRGDSPCANRVPGKRSCSVTSAF